MSIKVIEEKPLGGRLDPPLDQEGLIGSSGSRKELNDLGINRYNICQLTNNAISVVEERVNAKIAVNDMVCMRLKRKLEYLQESIATKEKQYTDEQGIWNKIQFEELSETKNDLKSRFVSLEDIMQQCRKTYKRTLIKWSKGRKNNLFKKIDTESGKLVQEDPFLLIKKMKSLLWAVWRANQQRMDVDMIQLCISNTE